MNNIIRSIAVLATLAVPATASASLYTTNPVVIANAIKQQLVYACIDVERGENGTFYCSAMATVTRVQATIIRQQINEEVERLSK